MYLSDARTILYKLTTISKYVLLLFVKKNRLKESKYIIFLSMLYEYNITGGKFNLFLNRFAV